MNKYKLSTGTLIGIGVLIFVVPLVSIVVVSSIFSKPFFTDDPHIQAQAELLVSNLDDYKQTVLESYDVVLGVKNYDSKEDKEVILNTNEIKRTRFNDFYLPTLETENIEIPKNIDDGEPYIYVNASSRGGGNIIYSSRIHMKIDQIDISVLIDGHLDFGRASNSFYYDSNLYMAEIMSFIFD
jgi:hypothetical protein